MTKISIEKFTPDKIKILAAWLSFFISFVVLALKFFAYFQTQSTAILSDAIESIINVVSSFVALLAMKAIVAPADKEHPYGHGKLEYFSSTFEGGLIAFASLLIAYEAILAFYYKKGLNELNTGLTFIFIATFINLLLSLFLKAIAKKHKSIALEASSKHVMSDVITTFGVFIGLFFVKLTGWIWLDPLVAILIAFQLAWSGIKIVRASVGGLIDETDPQSLNSLAEAIRKHRKKGLIDIHHLRAIRSGNYHHIDAHLVVPEYWDVAYAHTTTNDFEKKVVETYEYDGEMVFHLDPCAKSFCSCCDLLDCKIRKNPFRELRKFTPDELIKGPVKD